MPRAIVIGGSVGGLFVAHLLRQVGWEVTLFERSTAALAGRGAAIGFTEELIDVMRRVGARLDLSLGIDLRSYLALDHVGRVLHEEDRQGKTGAWAHIYRQLKDRLPAENYRAGMPLARVVQEGETVTALFADGSQETADLLVAADGAQSTVRQQFFPEVVPHYAGYVAWRGVVDEPDIPQADRDLIFNHLVFCLPPHELLLCIPIPGEDALHGGARRCCYIWYHPADLQTALPQLCTDASGRQHGTAISPALIRPEVIRALKDGAAALFAPVIANIVARAERPLFQAIFDLESPRLVSGRVALLGDAAFIARPHVVAGVTKAALDAQCLADALATQDVETALASYERERRDFGTRIVAHARRLGAHLTGDPHSATFMLREYGAPHLFRKAEPVDAARAGG
jgi:2-polyprenyl-6-methoxyphenol hydroxylase-like FAD-dependent oxidoreductase